ncbi:MAG: FtsZ-binding protein FzlA [Paracoccus sp. (in: a-proteobacteria)]|uniref:FtsZ-binding protein FzlA n=1 Tax=unclassified Paracoccus (in: a-proteobacteria) TaxID=2688777 RepID=UPI000C457773|nr:glutathione S-transferase family protein [Paracoccus sp. UBA5162]MAN55799.1 glutathione S-transferase [Paracoccus sp. (in: a-proteobacteria)]MCS5602212.1 glutathione S-transferase family protein [Paracoccus sp. (in: a-proteobacteria)]MDB2490385.1 glutathione S-transferase family protein [Paracoccus sp. (in: a-proteobacteria)]HIC66829.1 glutathione S-transferase family protein [Paracoccus sp. (in: a-proteobacteria)]|tara:strand:- start:24691 stop:25377 length:687 start_codon:yes stop_codon:yes gene_type:complete
MNTNTQTTRLYHSTLSPFCRKVRLVLAEKKIEVELVEEKYWENPPDLKRRNPAGKLPVLRFRGTMLAESQAIVEYIDEVVSESPLMPRGALDRHEVRRLCAWFDDKFNSEVTQPILNERVWKKILRSGYPDSRAVKDGLRAIKEHMDYLAGLLEDRRWLAGGAMSLADFTAAAHFSCLDYISDVDWDRSEVLRDWYATIKSRPAFRGVLADQVPGIQPAPHYAELDFG